MDTICLKAKYLKLTLHTLPVTYKELSRMSLGAALLTPLLGHSTSISALNVFSCTPPGPLASFLPSWTPFSK